jgi:hypothetical protein
VEEGMKAPAPPDGGGDGIGSAVRLYEVSERNGTMQWLEDTFNNGLLFFAIVVGVIQLAWWIHKDRVKSFVKDNPVGQAAKKAATEKAISMIFKLLK